MKIHTPDSDEDHSKSPVEMLRKSQPIVLSSLVMRQRSAEDGNDYRTQKLKETLLKTFAKVYAGVENVDKNVMKRLMEEPSIEKKLHDFIGSVNTLSDRVKNDPQAEYKFSLADRLANNVVSNAVTNNEVPHERASYESDPADAFHAMNVASKAHALAAAMGNTMPSQYPARTKLLSEGHPVPSLLKVIDSPNNRDTAKKDKDAASLQVAGFGLAAAYAAPIPEIMQTLEGDKPAENSETLRLAIQRAIPPLPGTYRTAG